MSAGNLSIIILLAEDDDDDALLIEKSFSEYRILNKLIRVKDGEELMEYLQCSGRYQDSQLAPKPDLILLDLNMPKKDGREALKEIKQHEDLKKIPITILTTSQSDEDIIRTYDSGVNSFVTKPVALNDFIKVVQEISDYWFDVVQLPSRVS